MRRNREFALALLMAVAVPSAAVADTPNCADADASELYGGCVEACELAPASAEGVSEAFVAKLRSIALTRHHVDTRFGDAIVTRLEHFRVAPFNISQDDRKRWKQNRKWAGPCTGLVAAFHSKAVEDKDDRNAVDLFELRYATEAQGRRAASLLSTSWDWNYHPFVALSAGRSVLVLEGRHRAWGALRDVARHFGGDFRPMTARRAPSWCDGELDRRPIFTRAAMAGATSLSVHVVGFSPSGGVAWLEESSAAAGGDARWSLHVNDMVNDRELATRGYRVATAGVDRFCARHGRDLRELLVEQNIAVGAYPVFDKPAPDVDPTAVRVRETGDARAAVVLVGRQGEKTIAQVAVAADRVQALGFVKNPFEARVVVMVLADPAPGGATLHMYGGRLDKGWIRP